MKRLWFVDGEFGECVVVDENVCFVEHVLEVLVLEIMLSQCIRHSNFGILKVRVLQR